MRGAGRLINNVIPLGFCLLAGLCPELSRAGPAEAGKIMLVKGDVFILGAKDKSVVADPLGKRGRNTQKGSSFFEGETVQTKDGARVKLLFVEGGNEIVLGSNTSLVIERAGATKPGTELSLRQGTVRSSVNRKYSGKDGDIFEVKTPNGVAGVRGTIFNVAYDSKKNMTQVFTERGAVAVTNLAAGPTAKPTMVKAGMFSEVSKTSEPTPAVVAPAQIIESVSPQANDESKDGDSSKSKKSDSSAASGSDGKSDAKTEVKKDDGPAVALAPQPADSTASSDGGRAPASAAPSAAPEAPKTMTSGGSAAAASQSGAAAIKPMDIINNQTASLRKASEEQLRQQRLIEGNLSEVNLTIK